MPQSAKNAILRILSKLPLPFPIHILAALKKNAMCYENNISAASYHVTTKYYFQIFFSTVFFKKLQERGATSFGLVKGRGEETWLLCKYEFDWPLKIPTAVLLSSLPTVPRQDGIASSAVWNKLAH